MTATLDPVTVEVLRHRLWMINDEQGRVAAQLSGSPVVYEVKDFNTSLLTPDGDSLFVGVYVTRLSLCLNFAVRACIDRFGAKMGFAEGDAFVTNDPWAGAAHQNDILMVAPIFWGEKLVCWTGLAMHEVDVGGPNPGSFTVGTPDVFGEAPLIPPVKMVEKGVIRDDIEAWIIRNSRTPQLNGLDLRARLAAINRTRQRIHEVIAEYGLDTFMAVQGRILDLVRASFARRLRGLPDGTWKVEGFIDHDGNKNELYRICLAMTKTDDRLKFDFTGTAKQARGSINGTRVGLESGVVSAILPMLCYDLPWSPGGLMSQIEFVSEEGTINNARHPAAVSMATVSATFATSHLSSLAIAKMLASSDLREEIQANWTPAWQGCTIAGHHGDGRPFTGVLLDQAGGGGGRSWKDGPDTGGLPGTPAMGIANVETYEKEFPLLYVYRRQAPDSGGPGLHRGGVGSEMMIVPHKNQGAIDVTVLTHGASQPEGHGLSGGYPSCVQVRLMLRGAKVKEALAAGTVPTDSEMPRRDRLEPLAAKQRTLMQSDDAVVFMTCGGGGYGDPIKRDPAAVARDVAVGLVTPGIARDLYGVALAGDAADAAATAALRAAIRKSRLADGVPVTDRGRPSGAPATGATILRIGDATTLVDTPAGRVHACQDCGHVLADGADDPKAGAVVRERRLETASPWNRYGLVDDIVIRELCCPSCAHLLATEVRKKDDPVLLDTALRDGAARPARAAAE